MKTQCLPPEQLGVFLTWVDQASQPGVELPAVLSDLLRRANALIPSRFGSIELRDPAAEGSRAEDELVVAACFGDLPDGLPGRRLPACRGLVRRTYRTGRAHLTPSEDDGVLAADGIGALVSPPPRAAICAPLSLGGTTVGVVELAEPRLGGEYSLRELALLEVLAQTISAWLAVAADARRAREMATRDNLTGLYNDRHLHRVLTRLVASCLAHGHDLGAVFIDLDRFKEVNDVHGHLAGSRVLQEVGRILLDRLPRESVAARYGGDEFVVLLPGCDRRWCHHIADSITRTVEHTVFLADADPTDPASHPAICIAGVVTCSVGIAMVGDIVAQAPDVDPVGVKNQLLRAADGAMYLAKERGRNRVVTAWESLAAEAETRPVRD